MQLWKIQNTQINTIINKIFLKQQHANCKVTQVLWISNWAVLLRLLKQDKSRTEGNPVNSSYNITLLLKYMIKRIKHGKIRITCRITLDQYHPSGLKALGLILMSRDDTTYDTDFAMYYSLCIFFCVEYKVIIH